jgi:hypothetical protein
VTETLEARRHHDHADWEEIAATRRDADRSMAHRSLAAHANR